MRSGPRDYTLFERLVVALSLFALSILLIDPFVLERAYKLPPPAREFFRTITDIGLSNWMLIPTGAATALAIVLWRNHTGFRKSAAYGLIASTIGFEFVSVGGAGLIAMLFKNGLGRARPKFYESVGHFEFQLFSFDPDYASIPSGHATNIFAFATVIALLWPRGRLLLYTVAAWIAASRVFIGVHYFTDAVLGAILGTAIPYLVRQRFAERRWLFERSDDGGYRIRGPRTQAWLGWPQRVRLALHGAASLANDSGNSGDIREG